MRRLSYSKGAIKSRSRLSRIKNKLKKWSMRLAAPVAAGLMLLPSTALARKPASDTSSTSITFTRRQRKIIKGLKKVPLMDVLKSEQKNKSFLFSLFSSKRGGRACSVPLKTVNKRIYALVTLQHKGTKPFSTEPPLRENKIFLIVRVADTKTDAGNPKLIDLTGMARMYKKLNRKPLKYIKLVVERGTAPSSAGNLAGKEYVTLNVIALDKPNQKIKPGMLLSGVTYVVGSNNLGHTKMPYVISNSNGTFVATRD